MSAAVPADVADDAAGRGRALEVVRRFTASPSRTAGVACGLAFALLLALRNRYLFGTAIYEDGDYAVNSILIDRASHFRLLVGNYSRVGFNHPGPALLYVQSWGQWIFHRVLGVVPTPYGGHLLGIIALNALLVGTAAAVVVHHCGRRWAAAAVAIVVLAVQPSMVASTWMPYAYVCPFLLFTVATASLLTGALRYAWAWALAAGLLAHGHVSFALFVGGTAGTLAAFGAWRLWRTRRRPPLRPLVPAAVLTLLFALPVVLNLLLHWPGELRRYLDYSNSDQAGGHPLGASVRYLRSYWTGDAQNGWLLIAGLVTAGVALTVTTTAEPARRFLRALALSGGLMTVLALAYVLRGVDDLTQTYIAAFYVCVPATTVLGIVVAAGLRLPAPPEGRRVPTAATVAAAGLALAAIVVATRPGLTNPYRGQPWVPDASAALEASFPTGTVMAMRFANNGWPQTAALFEHERRRGREVCLDDPQFGFLFSRAVVCTDAQRARARVVFIDADGREGDLVYLGPTVFIGDAGPAA